MATLFGLAPISTYNGHWKSLLRKAEVMTARAELLKDGEGTRIGLIEAAKPVTADLFEVLEGRQPGDLTDLLVQFDAYRSIAMAGTDDSDRLGAYPNFALYYSKRAEPAFLAVLDDAEARTALYGGTDAQLAAAFRRVDSAAQREAFAYNGWDGFDDARLLSFAGAGDG